MGKSYELSKFVNEYEWTKCKVPKMVMQKNTCEILKGDGYCKKYGKIPVFIQKEDEETFKVNLYGFVYGVGGDFKSCVCFAEKYLKEQKTVLLKEMCLLFKYVNEHDGCVSKSDYMDYVREIRMQS